MVNADSWQSSVIELAQAGNLRAIAFWINRYLVPQGICAQVLSERPGHLVVRTVCHHAPDGDRLVRFICHRLTSLNSEVIQTVRITAQLVGSSQLLWMKSARLSRSVPPAQTAKTQTAKTMPLSPATAPPGYQAGQKAAAFAPGAQVPIAHVFHPVQPPQPAQQTRQTRPIQFVENPRPAVAGNPPAISSIVATPPSTATVQRRKKRKPKRPLLVRWSRSTVQHVVTLPQTMRQLSTQSIDWFTGQTLPVRALTLGGSAVAIFFIGCGFELVRQYVADPAFREFTAASSYAPRNTVGTVKAALERVPVIHADGSDPDNPAVTLLFSNSAALGQVPKASIDSISSASLDGASPEPAGGIAAYRQADLVMTSLDNSLSLQQLLPAPGEQQQDAAAASLPIPEQSATPQTNERDTGRNSTATTEKTSESEDADNSAKLPPVNIHELLANGIDIVNLANEQPPASEQTREQTSGQPPQAESTELVQTIDVLNRSDIQPLGAGDMKEARRPRIFQVKGQRIAYLGYAESPPSAEETEASVTPELIQQMTEDIQAIRDQVDWIVVSFHWQQGLRAYPEDWQTSLAHLAIDQGADLVVGYHPNVTQGAELYRGRAIAYSLGSSIEGDQDESSDDEATAGDRDTVTLKVSLQDKQMKLEFLPVQIRQREATLASGEAAGKILRQFEQASSFFDHPAKSKTTLDARVRMSLPTAPDAELPTEPFLSEPEAPQRKDEG